MPPAFTISEDGLVFWASLRIKAHFPVRERRDSLINLAKGSDSSSKLMVSIYIFFINSLLGKHSQRVLYPQFS